MANPSFSNLVDSTGAATGVGLSLTGSVKAFSGFNNPSTDALRKDYIFFNSPSNPATSLSWEITGLVACAAYDFFAYGGDASSSRGWIMRVDKGGSSDKTVAGLSGTASFAGVIADGSGRITGSVLPSGDGITAIEVDWAAFQLLALPPATVPEPGTSALLVVGLMGLGAAQARPKSA